MILYVDYVHFMISLHQVSNWFTMWKRIDSVMFGMLYFKIVFIDSYRMKTKQERNDLFDLIEWKNFQWKWIELRRIYLWDSFVRNQRWTSVCVCERETACGYLLGNEWIRWLYFQRSWSWLSTAQQSKFWISAISECKRTTPDKQQFR